jgi:hypothetical protein
MSRFALAAGFLMLLASPVPVSAASLFFTTEENRNRQHGAGDAPAALWLGSERRQNLLDKLATELREDLVHLG